MKKVMDLADARIKAVETMQGSELTKPVQLFIGGHTFRMNPLGDGVWGFAGEAQEKKAPGRPRKAIEPKEVKKLRKTMNVAAIAKKLGVSAATVYNLLRL